MLYFMKMGHHNSWAMVKTYTVLARPGNLDKWWLASVSSKAATTNLRFLLHHSTWYNSALPILWAKKRRTSFPNLAFDTLPCQISKCLASQGDLNALQRKTIFVNKSMGKFRTILTMPLRYFGRNKHFMNW